jgi:type IV secretory pathway TraG/TraD family ATPase VirD4
MVALSAHLDEEIYQRCLSAGMVKSFVKPLDAKKVQEISNLLKTKKQKNQKQKHSYRIDKNKTNSFTRRSRRHG